MTRQLTEADTGGSGRSTRSIKQRFAKRWMHALDTYHADVEAIATDAALSAAEAEAAKQTAVSRLVARWHEVIGDSLTDAHSLGGGVWGAGAVQPGPQFAAEVARQKGFASRFALDIASGVPQRPGRMNVAPRSQLYVEAVETAFQRGAVDGAPPGQLIDWVLGLCQRHCIDCPILAGNSPYTRDTLPTVPRSGTQCGARCCCSLEFRSVEVEPPSPESQEQARPLDDRLDGITTKPPDGLRLPDAGEHRVLKDLEQRRNFATRRADSAAMRGDFDTRDKWLEVERATQRRLREFADERGVWHVPTWSQAEVLRGADVGMDQVDRLTHIRGIDGKTVHRADAAAIRQAAREAIAGARDMLAGVPARRSPAVPDFDELLRLAGAPSASRTGVFEAERVPLLEAVEVEALAKPGDHVVANVVGQGIAATLYAAVEAVELMAEVEHDVEVGPLDDEWARWVAFAGLFVRGPAEDVQAFVSALSRRVGGRGVEVARWQA